MTKKATQHFHKLTQYEKELLERFFIYYYVEEHKDENRNFIVPEMLIRNKLLKEIFYFATPEFFYVCIEFLHYICPPDCVDIRRTYNHYNKIISVLSICYKINHYKINHSIPDMNQYLMSFDMIHDLMSPDMNHELMSIIQSICHLLYCVSAILAFTLENKSYNFCFSRLWN